MTSWAAHVEVADPEFAPNVRQRSRIVPVTRGDWSATVAGAFTPTHHLLLDDRPLPTRTNIFAPTATRYRTDAHDELDDVVGGPIPLFPFSTFGSSSPVALEQSMLAPSFTLRLRWLGEDVDSRFVVQPDGRLACARIGAAHPLIAACGIALDVDAWFDRCGPEADLREVLARGGEVWGPVELLLMFGGFVQELLLVRPTDEQLLAHQLLRSALGGEVRQLYRALPSTAELDAVLEEQSQTIPLLPDRHRATVLAEETTIGWTVAVNLTSRSPSGIEYTQPYLGSTVYETIRDVTAATPDIVVMIAPLGAPPTQHAPADPALPDLLSDLGLA